MITAETSYMSCGNFFDMEEGIAGQYHLEPRWAGDVGDPFRVLQHRRMRRLGMSEVCQCAHMKSFSLFYRRMYDGMGSLDERRCSRITPTGG